MALDNRGWGGGCGGGVGVRDPTPAGKVTAAPPCLPFSLMEKDMRTERTPLFAPSSQAQYFPGPAPVRSPTYEGEEAAPSPRSPTSSPSNQQFSLESKFKKKALMLDTDVHFKQSNKIIPDLTRPNFYNIH